MLYFCPKKIYTVYTDARISHNNSVTRKRGPDLTRELSPANYFYKIGLSEVQASSAHYVMYPSGWTLVNSIVASVQLNKKKYIHIVSINRNISPKTCTVKPLV